jgi:hypothetical protein
MLNLLVHHVTSRLYKVNDFVTTCSLHPLPPALKTNIVRYHTKLLSPFEGSKCNVVEADVTEMHP